MRLSLSKKTKLLCALFILPFLLTSCAALFTKTKQDEKSAYLQMKLGLSFLKQNSHPLALSHLLKAEEYEPENPLIQNSLGLIYTAMKQNKTATKKFLKALKLNPQYTEARNNLAFLFLKMKKYSHAKTLLLRSRTDLTYRKPYKTYAYLGALYSKLNKNKIAYMLFNKALKMNPNDCYARNELSHLLYKEKKFDDVKTHLTQNTVQCPLEKNLKSLFYLGMSHYYTKNYSDAYKILSTLSKTSPTYSKKIKSILNVQF